MQSKFESLLVENKSPRESRAIKKTKVRFKNRFAKGENKACKKAKTRFKNRFAKGESRAC